MMVAPKKPARAIKEKSDGSVEQKSVSSSPEPFREPDGMTTIDLNKGDDYSGATEAENEKLKQKAQIRYVRRLLIVLGSILFMVFSFIATAFLNKQYHLFTTIPLKINQSNPNPRPTASPSPTEEFVNLTKILNQALFKQKLKSGNYLESAHQEMSLCRLKQTVDVCCEILKGTDLSGLVEYCTVNDMLDVLLEFELDRRKKRQAFDYPYPPNEDFNNMQYPSDEAYYHHSQGQHFVEMPQQLMPAAEDHQYHYENHQDRHVYNVQMPPPINSGDMPHQRQSPNVQTFLPMPQRTRDQILQHVTNAPKHERNYRYEDFHGEHSWPIRFVEENGANFRHQESIREPSENIHRTAKQHQVNVNANNVDTRDSDGTHQHDFGGHPGPLKFLEDKTHIPEGVHGVFDPRRKQSLGEDHRIINFEKEFGDKFFEGNEGFRETEQAPFAARFTENDGQMKPFNKLEAHDAFEPDTATEVYKQQHTNYNQKHVGDEFEDNPRNTESAVNIPRNMEINPNLKNVDKGDEHLKSHSSSSFSTKPQHVLNPEAAGDHRNIQVGDPQKKPLVSKFGDNVQIRENITTHSNSDNPVNLDGSEDTDEIKIPPNLKITKKKDELDHLNTSALPKVREADVEAKLNSSRFNFNEEAAGIASTITPSRTTDDVSSKDALKISEQNQEAITDHETEDFMVGDPQKKPLVSKFGDNVQIRENITTHSNSDNPVNLDGNEDTDEIKIPPNLKITKKKDELDHLNTSALPEVREADVEAKLNGSRFNFNEDTAGIASTITPSRTTDDVSSKDALKISEQDQEAITDHETEDFMVGDPHKKPLVSKFGDNVQIRENITTHSKNDNPVNLDGSEDADEIKIPPNLKITKKKDELDHLNTSVLPKVRKADVEAKLSGSRFNFNEDAAGIAPTIKPFRTSGETSSKHALSPVKMSEEAIMDDETKDVTVGDPQKKPLVSKFFDNEQIRENITTHSNSENPVNLDGSEDADDIKIPPNLQITKKKDELDHLNTSVLPKAKGVDVEANLNGSRFEFNEEATGIASTITPSRTTDDTSPKDALKMPGQDQEAIMDHETKDFRLGDPQKKPLVSKFGDNVQIRENTTTHSKNDNPVNLDRSEDADEIKIPPNLKITKKKDELDHLNTSVLPEVREADVEAKLNSSRFNFNEEAAGIASTIKPFRTSDETSSKHALSPVKMSEEAITDHETKDVMVGDPQKKPLVSKFFDNEQIRENITTHSNSENPVNLDGSEDADDIKIPPNLQITKKKDELDHLNTSVLPKAKGVDVEANLDGSRFEFNEEATGIASTITPSRTTDDTSPKDALKMPGQDQEAIMDHETKDFRLGDPQKKPLVSKFGDNVQIRENITTHSKNDNPVNLDGSEDADDIKIPPNLKITKKKDELDHLNTSVLPTVREADVEAKFNGSRFNFNEEAAGIASTIKPSRTSDETSSKHALSPVKMSEEAIMDDETKDVTVGDPQKKPLVSKFGNNVQIRENTTTHSKNDNPVNLDGSEGTDEIKIPPNLKITKKKGELDHLNTSALPQARGADVEAKLNSSRFRFNEEAAGIASTITPSRTTDDTSFKSALKMSEQDQEATTDHETKNFMVGDPQKKPLVSKFGDNVQIRENTTTHSKNDNPVNLDRSEDADEIKIPPNLKITKKKDELDHLNTSVLPEVREADVEAKLNSSRFNFNEEAAGIASTIKPFRTSDETSSKHALSPVKMSEEAITDHETKDVMVGDPQKKPLVSKFFDNVQIRENITTHSNSENPVNLEGSKDGDEVKIPPNLKITKKKDELDHLNTSALPKARESEFNEEAAGIATTIKPSRTMEKLLSHQSSTMEVLGSSKKSDQPTNLNQENEDLIVGVAQKKPLMVSKLGDNVQIPENLPTNSNSDDPIRLEGSDDSSQIKIPPNTKVTKTKDDLDITTKVLQDIAIKNERTSENLGQTNEKITDGNNVDTDPTKTKLSESRLGSVREIMMPNRGTFFNINQGRANTAQDEFRVKTKQLDGLTPIEDMQSNQQSLVNPCFYPYMNPYMPFLPSPGNKVGSPQDSSYLKIVSVSQPKVQNLPAYVLNPAMYYGIPPSAPPTYPTFPPNPYLTSSYYPPMAQTLQNPATLTQAASVQVAAPGGQYYLCNPIPTPTNNIAALAGVEVRRDASNLQNLMAGVEEEFAVNNRSREATLICPLGEHPCLDNSKCVKNHHICDSEVHCDDSSDEVACSCKERVGKLRLCDGYCDCPRCEDEQGCFGCGENEFSCDDWSRFRRSTCIPTVQRCDGVKQCEITGKDEMDCSILADHIGNFPLNKISNSVGFLHRNYKGKWYPTCFGAELWAAQVCQVEAGPSAIIPKAHMTLTTDPYNGLFINILPNNEVSLVNTCVQDRAAFVECPPIYCGLRFLVNNPYRDQEVDTSIEDMLNDLERAYKARGNGYERSDLDDSDVDLGRIRKNSQRKFDAIEDPVRLDLNNDEDNNSRKRRQSARNLTQEHLEEVIENLERTFRRRDVSRDRFDATLKESRVVGGKPSQPAAWPWLVSIYKNGIFHCGGVLINELWVVTASHCVDRYWQYYYEIQAGALRRFSYAPMDQRRWATIVVPHEFYSKSNLRNDIALMKLSAPVRYNRYVRPICLPSESTSGQDFLKGPSVGTICTTVGWGATVEHGADPDHMREVEVPILQHCKHKEDSDIQEICAGLSEGGKDACQGDSGGPLMCRNPNNPNQWYLAGIVSHGEGCARPNEPGVYTKVSRYIGWIADNTREDKLTITNPLRKCPGFVCKGTKRCVAKKRRCDRIIDCLFGDDEIDCENKFKEIFKHSRKSSVISTPDSAHQPSDDFVTDIVESLVPLENFGLLGSHLNSTKDNIHKNTPTADETVEDDLYHRLAGKEAGRFEDVYFKCKTLLQVIPMEKRCNKILDCEDGTDEINCSCADYIETVDAGAINDGVTDCTDLSDENGYVKCNKTEYLCQLSQKCIEISKRCDGNSDCPQNEDEMNCIALSNGHNLTIDKDNRPMLKSRGIVTVNHQGQWNPFCLNNSSSFVNDEPSLSTVICNLLGFDEFLTYHKYQTENTIINTSYSMIDGRTALIPPPQKCENCNCNGLYVSCSNTSTSTTLHYKSLEQAREVYFSPWTAAIYYNGRYKCMGTLLDTLWIVTSQGCVKGNQALHLNYLVAVLGKGKLQLSVKGPHEQVIRIGAAVNVKETDIVLLRLEDDVKFNRYVQAADLNARRDGHRKEKCYAVGQDNENKVLFVALTPLKACVVGFRCFEAKIEEDCNDAHAWSGTVICDSRVGWYPAAVFNEENGHCGFSHKKKYTSVRFYKNQIFKIMALTPKSTPSPFCSGFQCHLGNCIPQEKICDGVSDCHNGEDEVSSLCYEKEKDCHLSDNCVCSPTHLKCPGTNKCHPKSTFCDRTNDCGEFEDEPDVCSCRNYLKLTNPDKICDATLNCMDRTDEDPEICSCKLGDFQCGKLNKCVPQEMVCDGIEDCPNGEDEKSCLAFNSEGHGHEKITAGEVMTMTAGTWHNGCFDLVHPDAGLEEICSKLGFNGSSASQLTPPHNLTTLSTLRPVLDSFEVVWLRRRPGNKLRFRLRSGHDPYVKFVTDKKCHRLFIACI